jgi:hypothetical protein
MEYTNTPCGQNAEFCTVKVHSKWWYIWEPLAFKRLILKDVKIN